MTRRKDEHDHAVLDEQSLHLLGASAQPFALSQQQKTAIHTRLKARITEQESTAFQHPVTIPAEQDIWLDVAPKIQKKQLFIDRENNTEIYLLKALPGAVLPPHRHQQTEILLMLEGDLKVGKLHLHTGDFHISPEGSKHRSARTEQGCIVYMQGQIFAMS